MAALVIAAILIIGPTVVRSINAHFKSLEEGAHDSFRENIQQAPPGGGVVPPGSCGGWVDSGGCGNAATCRSDQSPPETYRVWTRTCTPLGYTDGFPTIECRDDLTNTCCTAPVPTGLCAAAGGCNNGEMQNSQQCGSPTPGTVYTCQPDPDCFQCIPPLDPYAKWCNPLQYNQGVTAPTPISYYDYGACPSSPTCAAECPPWASAILNVGCVCPPFSSPVLCPVPIGEPPKFCCECDAGYYNFGTSYPVGPCNQGDCGSGFCQVLQCCD